MHKSIDSKLKIAINYDNIIFSLQKVGGISLYWFELLNRIRKDRAVVKFYQSPNNNLFIKKIDLTSYQESIIPNKLLRYFPFTKSLKKNSIFHSSYYRVSLQASVANITTVHDFTYEHFSSGLTRKIHSLQKNFAIRRSSGVICVSENTKRDLLNFLPDIEPNRIKVIYNGVGDEFFPLEPDEATEINEEFFQLSDKKIVLFVGDRSSYKNFDKVVQVVKLFPDLSLVIAGGKPFNDSENKILSDLEGRFFSYMGISSKSLNWLYNHAFCLLYPSSYEGFGIPVLEAMKSGCPVVSTNLSSIPEIAGDAAILVDEINVRELAICITSLYDLDFRKSIIDKGLKQAKRFSWEKCFDETMAFYEEVWQREFGDNF